MVGLSAAGAVPYVQAFDSLLAGPVAEYLKISKEIGGDVQKHVRMFGPFFSLLKRTNGFLQILLILGLRTPCKVPGSFLANFCLEFSAGTEIVPQIFLGPLLLSHNLCGLLLYR